MCGIYGAVARRGEALRTPAAIQEMAESLHHRGPDSGGFRSEPRALLGARRLSIVDLASEADQPFESPDGRVWLCCNGEIYNAPALRAHFASRGYPFRSRHNDVESILPLYLEFGLEAIARLEGMFALAIWDARSGSLLLARDRAGEKPLFYAERSGELHFASEIHPLLGLTAQPPTVSQAGLADYLSLGYSTAPRTLFQGVEKLEAGHALVADRDGIRLSRFWDPLPHAQCDELVEPRGLTDAIDSAVRRQLTADVPIGVFTSGGLDSSLLATHAVRNSSAGSVHTYALRFEEASFDESDWAARVCGDLGTHHHPVDASEDELHRALDHVTRNLAEPLGDPALLPTWLLSEAAARDVKVVLSGEGADELFGGYPTYLGHRWAERYASLPPPIRKTLHQLVHRLPVSGRKVSLEFLAKRFVDEAEEDTFRRHLAWFGALGPAATEVSLSAKGSSLPAQWARLSPISDPIKRCMLFDLVTYLAENLLTKVDRATMLASVEARAPFLDIRVMELALRQPSQAGVGALRGKRLLKRAARGRVPRAVLRRRKRGLSVPVSRWLNEGLRAECDRLLAPDRLHDQGLLAPERSARLGAEHRSGQADHGRRIWPLFILQRWHERWIESTGRH